MNVMLWHVHGSWTTAFVQGKHRYVVPVVPGRGPDGRGRAETWTWPDAVVERTPEELADEEIDVLVVQRPEEECFARAWLRRTPGRDVPMIWLEHNAPQGRIDDMRHPASDRADIVLVHVTHTNALFWSTGRTRTRVIEHGIIDPGERYTGELTRAAVAINEPERRRRVVGADLLETIATAAPVDLFGIGAATFATRREGIVGHEDVPQSRLHDELARRRVYVHPFRWTSLGLTLLEAMHLGMPVVALATTEVPEAVPPTAGVVTNRIDVVQAAVRHFLVDEEDAQTTGRAARRAALDRFGLGRFLHQWDALLHEVAA
jgi:hypothetical protein